MEELDEFGIAIRKPKAEVDEFGIPIKKKDQSKLKSTGSSTPLPNGSSPFQSVDTSRPTPLYTDKQKSDQIGERFNFTPLNVPTEFGRVGSAMKAAKKVKDTLPQLPSSDSGMVVIPQGEKTGDSLRIASDFREEATDDFTNQKTGLQKQIDSATGAFRDAQGNDLANEVQNYERPEETLKIKEELGFGESVSRTGKNFVNRLEQFIPNTALALGGTFETILGEDIGSDFYAQMTRGGDMESHRREAFARLDELKPAMEYTKGFIESGKDFDIPGLMAAVVDATSSLLSTVITSAPTAGIGLYSDMVGGGVYDYNTTKAQRLGMSVEELYKTGQNEFLVPAMLQGFSARLESIGLKGIKQGILANVKKGSGQKFALIAHGMNREGYTEFLQTGVDASQRALAEGKNPLQAGEEAVRAMFSKEGAEAYLMGMVASGSAIVGGRMIKGLITPKAKKQVTENSDRINEMLAELDNPNLPETARAIIIEDIKSRVSKVVDAVDSDVDIAEKLDAEQKQKIEQLTMEIEELDEIISDSPVGTATTKMFEESRDKLRSDLDAILKENPKKPPVDPPATGGAMVEETVDKNTVISGMGVEPIVEETVVETPTEEISETIIEEPTREVLKTDKLYAVMGGRRVEVDSLEEASANSQKLVEEMYNRGGDVPYISIELQNDAGDVVAHISQNGKVWSGTEQDFFNGGKKELIYDPYSKDKVETVDTDYKEVNEQETKTQTNQDNGLNTVTGSDTAVTEEVDVPLIDEINNNETVVEEQVTALKKEKVAEISPNKSVKANQKIASEEISNLKGIRPKEGEVLFTAFKDKKGIDLFAQDDDYVEFNEKDGIPIAKIPPMLVKSYEALEEQGLIDKEYGDETYYLTPKGREFNDAVQARLSTRKAVKAGTDMFPSDAGISEAQEQKGAVSIPVPEVKNEDNSQKQPEKALVSKAGDPLRKLADKIEQGKINKLGGFKASTGFDAVWDGSLTVVAQSLRTGAKLADAIESGLKYVRQTDWYKDLTDKENFESQYKSHLEKEYASEESSEVNSEPKPPKQDEEPVEDDDTPERKKRRATKRVMKSNEYSEAFKEAITENTIYYKTLPNSITEKEAEAFIDIQGEFDSESALMDFNNGMSSAVRFSVMQKLIDRYEANGEYLRAAELAETLYSTATDYGQGIQIFATFPKLHKKGQVAIARKNVNKQRDEFRKKTTKTTTKIAKEFKKVNKETAEETVEAVKKIIEANTKVKPEGSITDLPLGYGTKNKVFTREKYLKAKQRIRGMALSGIPTAELIDIAGYHIEATGRDFPRFVRRMKADLGAKIKPFLKDIYSQTRESLIQEGYDKALFLTDAEVDAQLNEQEGQVWKEKLDKAIQKKDEKAQKVAIKKLQEISKDEGVWGQYKESAAKKLKGMLLTNAEKDISSNPSLQQFTDGLVKNMRQKMAELLPEQPKKKVVPRPDIEIIGDAYKNVEQYKEVWEKTQAEFQEKYADQPEVLESIDEYFGEILDKPFSDRLLERAISKGLKDIDKTIADLVIQHYTVIDNAKQTLADKLVNDAGLTGEEANNLSKAVQRKFDEIATKKKQGILEKMFSKRERKKPAVRSMEGDLIKLSNLGAFRTDEIIELYGDKMGWPKLTEENIKEIERLSDVVQSTYDPIKKRRAVEDLLAYQAKIKGHSITELVTAVWYANVLSGYNTQIVNFGANAINTGLLYANAIAQRPKDARFIGRGLIQGIQRGWLEAQETLKTGYSPIKGKAEVPQLLEREKFKKFNVLNYLKYVRRVMIAADVIFFEGQKEMRAYQMASKEAAREGKLDPMVDQRNRAIELVGKSDRQIEIIQEQVEVEVENEIREINASDATQEEKTKLIKQSERDKPRRIFDLIEQQRSGELIQETSEFAARGTYNYQPKGALGAIAGALNQAVESVPVLRYAVPFTNIIANVANETIEYTPLALTRLKKGGYTNFRREDLTDQQRVDLMTKAIIGTTLMATAFALTQVKGDDDEPFLEITSNGTGDYAKNTTLKEQGWQEYSFRFKKPSGEYTDWYSYQYSPLILGLGFIGHVNDLIKYKEEKDEDTIVSLMSKAAGLTVATLFQATYLEGFGDMLATILDPRSSGGTIDKGIQGALGAVKGVVIPNLFSQTSQSLQDIFGKYKKETRETLAGKVLQDIPYARDQYYDKINILGEPISPDTDKFHSADEPNKIIQLLVDKKAVFAPINRKTEKIYDMDLGHERILTDEEFYNYSRDKGQFIKNALTDDYKELKDLNSEKFKKELTRIKSEATKQARRNIGEIPVELTKIEIKNEEYLLSPQQIKERKRYIEDYVRLKGRNTIRVQRNKGKSLKEAENILQSEARGKATEKLKIKYKNGIGLEKI